MKGDHIGEFEELVLLTVLGLSAEPDGAYGVSIKAALEREASRDVSIGAVYAALERLEQKGLVRSAMTPGTAARGGRSRRAFTVAAAGTRALQEMRRVRSRLWATAETARSRS